jgi:hypothetical protein
MGLINYRIPQPVTHKPLKQSGFNPNSRRQHRPDPSNRPLPGTGAGSRSSQCTCAEPSAGALGGAVVPRLDAEPGSRSGSCTGSRSGPGEAGRSTRGGLAVLTHVKTRRSPYAWRGGSRFSPSPTPRRHPSPRHPRCPSGPGVSDCHARASAPPWGRPMPALSSRPIPL